MTGARSDAGGQPAAQAERRCPIQSGELAYAERGSGPAIVFLHGATLTSDLWDPQVERLASRHRCITVDLRGHGRTTSAPRDAYDIGQHAEDIVSLLDHLGLDAAHLVGLSLGGLVAVETALTHPERVRSVVSMSAGLHGLSRQTRSIARALIGTYFWRVDRSGMAWAAKVVADRVAATPETRAWFRAAMLAHDPDEHRRVLRGVLQHELRSRLGTLDVPVLVLSGSRDPVRRSAARGARLMPGSAQTTIDGASHLTNRDRPEIVNAHLVRWFDGVAPATPVGPDS